MRSGRRQGLGTAAPAEPQLQRGLIRRGFNCFHKRPAIRAVCSMLENTARGFSCFLLFCLPVSQGRGALTLSVSGSCTGLPVCSGRCGFIPCTLLAQYQITHSLPTGMPGSPGATFPQAPETESRNEAQRAGWRQPLGALLHQRCAVRWAVCWPG